MSHLDAAVQRVWPGKDARVEVLGGGITNHNLKVEVDGELFLLRVAGRIRAYSGSTGASNWRRRRRQQPSESAQSS